MNLVICQNLKNQKGSLPDAHQKRCSRNFHKSQRKNTHAKVSPLQKPQALRLAALLKRDHNTGTPPPIPPAPTRAKTREITLNWKITNPDQFGIIKVFGDKEGKSALMHNTWHKAVTCN